MLRQAEPQDLLKYGLIPEFVGRLPVLGILDELDEVALIEILTKPRNAILKQYAKLFDYEGVKVTFTDDAAKEIAREALQRKVGARGLRMILEELMLDLMYLRARQQEDHGPDDHRGDGEEAQPDPAHAAGEGWITVQ